MKAMRPILVLVILVGAFGLDASALAQRTAPEMLKRAAAIVRDAKTWQGTIGMSIAGAPGGSLVFQYDVKRAGKKVWARVTAQHSGAAPPRGGKGIAPQEFIVVDDGHQSWMYMPALKTYKRESGGAGL